MATEGDNEEGAASQPADAGAVAAAAAAATGGGGDAFADSGGGGVALNYQRRLLATTAAAAENGGDDGGADSPETMRTGDGGPAEEGVGVMPKTPPPMLSRWGSNSVRLFFSQAAVYAFDLVGYRRGGGHLFERCRHHEKGRTFSRFIQVQVCNRFTHTVSPSTRGKKVASSKHDEGAQTLARSVGHFTLVMAPL